MLNSRVTDVAALAVFRAAPGERCGLLAAWYAAFATGAVTAAEAAGRAGRHDELTLLRREPVPAELPELLTRLRGDGVTRLELVLPVPGDVRGLPGPGAFAEAALEVGEGLLTRGGSARVGLIPSVSFHGPFENPDVDGRAEDTATICTWLDHPVDQPELLAMPMLTVAEADSDLKLALLDSTQELARLDVARWSPEITGPLTKLRDDARRGRGAASHLPASHPSAARALLSRAEPLARVLALAEATPGLIVTGRDELGRSGVLRSLASAVRRARLAAYNAV